jgi:hypothetical protein
MATSRILALGCHGWGFRVFCAFVFWMPAIERFEIAIRLTPMIDWSL